LSSWTHDSFQEELISMELISYYLIELQMGFYPWQWYYNKTRHKNTHITQNNTLRSNKAQQKNIVQLMEVTLLCHYLCVRVFCYLPLFLLAL
jgi:hypothetical protein